MTPSTPGSMLRYIFPLVGAGIIVAGFMEEPGAMTDDGLMRVRSFSLLLGGFFIALPFALAFVLGRVAARRRARRDFFSRHGTPGTATITAIERTGTEINDQPQLRFTFTVVTASGRTVASQAKAVVDLLDLAKLREGMEVPALVHPEHEQDVLLDWDAVGVRTPF